MTIPKTQTPHRCGPRLSLAALILAFMLLPCANAGDKFSVRATLTSVPSVQTGDTFVLSGRLSRPHAEPALHLGSSFGLIGTLSPQATRVCYGDTIFRDGFDYL